MSRWRRSVAVAGLLWLCMPARALAQSGEEAAAEALFNQARQLFDDGQTAEACKKFAESQRLAPSAGTLLNLANCQEKDGKTASAWSGFLAAKRAATADGRAPLAEEAARRAQALEANLSYLTLQVSEAPEGFVLLRGDQQVASGTFGTRLPVDPGTYPLRATAPGYLEWSGAVTVVNGEVATAAVPRLTKEPTKPAAAAPRAPLAAATLPSPASPATDAAPQRNAPLAAYLVGGAGLAVTGVGFLFGALAQGAYGEAQTGCPTHANCDATSMQARRSADTFAAVSTVGVGVGLAAVATGVVMWALHGSQESTGALGQEVRGVERRVRPDVALLPGGAFAAVSGRF